MVLGAGKDLGSHPGTSAGCWLPVLLSDLGAMTTSCSRRSRRSSRLFGCLRKAETT